MEVSEGTRDRIRTGNSAFPFLSSLHIYKNAIKMLFMGELSEVLAKEHANPRENKGEV